MRVCVRLVVVLVLVLVLLVLVVVVVVAVAVLCSCLSSACLCVRRVLAARLAQDRDQILVTNSVKIGTETVAKMKAESGWKRVVFAHS